MRKDQLEHIIRAAGAISGSNRIVVLGSQAVLASKAELAKKLTASMEADIYPEDEPCKADMIDGSIGELSPFHETFGYYAHGVGPETAILPENWRERTVSIQNQATQGVEGVCIGPDDLAASKLIAGREKDISFVRRLIEADIASKMDIENVSEELSADHREMVLSRLASIVA